MTEFKIGDVVLVSWLDTPELKLSSEVPIMDIKGDDNFKQYLVYYIESDGPFPNWKIKESLTPTGKWVDINTDDLCVRIRKFENENH